MLKKLTARAKKITATLLASMVMILGTVMGPMAAPAAAYSYNYTNFDGMNTRYTDVSKYWYTPNPVRVIQENMQSVYVYFYHSEGDPNPYANNCAQFRIRFFPMDGSSMAPTSWTRICSDVVNPSKTQRVELADRILKGTRYRVEQVSVKSLDYAPVFTLVD